ncbi:elongator complex protein 6-like [Colletes gigas]|uniref:elongator complex protein 6-like n=1 Tax=Colletes gigas TaxID=935657 RepID=UPI001C9B18A3|nr:elongator complex protein 6-like [Colletes gigas]
MDLVSNMLGIDKVNMGGKLILIEERHETDANFLLSSIILDALKKNYNICLVLFHNTFNHFHNVSIKFGCNLAMLRKEGKVKVVEPMKIVAAALQNMDKGTADNIVHHLLTAIKNEYDAPAVIVIDDLSHLYNLGFHLRDVVYCMRYLRSLIECNKESQLCIVVHTYEQESQSCVPDTFVDGLKHMSHLFLAVEPFETGYSSDMSGKITVNWRIDCIRRKYNWSETVKYVYKLSDHQVKVYTSGNVPG